MKNLKGIKVLNENEMKMVTGGNTSLPTDIKLPCIAQLRFSKEIMHFVVIYKVKRNVITITDPAKGFRELSCKIFSKCFTNKVLLIY